MPAEDMTIRAKWTVNQYTITFDTNGGSAIAPIRQDYGTKVEKPANPTKANYTFAGWSPEIPDTMPEGDMTVKAQWKLNSAKSVKTGDDSNMPLWITLLVLLILGMIGFNVYRIRKNKKQKST